MKRRNVMIAAILAMGAGALGSAVAQGYGPEGGQGMRGGMMQGGMGPGGMGPGGMGPGGMGPGGMAAGGKGGMMKGGGMMDPAARVEQRLTRLKDEIKPSEKQLPLWQAFAEKSRNEASKGAETMRQRMSDTKPMTAPERLAQMQAGMKDRLVAMEAVSESFNRLYAALTPEQKAAADRHFSNMGRPQGPGRGGPPRQAQPPAQEPSHKH